MLTLLYHPLSSYCQKALIGLDELEVPFAPQVVDLGDPDAVRRHARLAAYFDRLATHPSVARTFAEAAPYLPMFPG